MADIEWPFSFMDGFVLAGGMSRRMGRNKAGLQLDGRTFLERSAEALGAVSKTVRIVGDLRGEHSNIEVLPDIVGEGTGNGAIVGLLSALQYTDNEWAAVLACDLPFATMDLMLRMAEIAKTVPEVACVIPAQEDGRIQPLCGLYRKTEALAAVDQHYRSGERRLQRVVRQLNSRIVSFDELEDLPGASNFFFNVNSPLEYEEALKIANAPFS